MSQGATFPRFCFVGLVFSSMKAVPENVDNCLAFKPTFMGVIEAY